MEIGAELKREAFRKLLKQGFVFRLRGDEPFASVKYHLFVVMNYDSSTGDALLLVNGTSKVAKRKEYLKNTGADVEKTTVTLEAGSYDFITKETIFDCNELHCVNLECIDFDDGNTKFVYDELSEYDVKKMVEAVKSSDRVARALKDLL